jgi:nitrite reductase/ring-hydroxylating ferredoxin subunit
MPASWERVALLSELRASGGRLLARLASGRGVALFLPGPGARAVFALDHACYHHGGPLVDGDIEDVPGVGACVLCPWHKYRIALASGEGFYVGVTFGAAGPPREELKSKGLRQRTHPCRLAPVAVSAASSSSSAASSSSSAAFSGLDASADDAGADADADADALADAADAAAAASISLDADGDAAVEVLDMGLVESAASAARLGGRAALRAFREQRGAGPAAAAAALALSGAGACSPAAAPPSAAMAAAVRAQAASNLAQSDNYARKPFNAVTVSCRGEVGGDGGGFNGGAGSAGGGGGGGGAPSRALPLHSSMLPPAPR